MSKPLVFDGYCGLGGWTEGFLAEGWRAIGIDIERHNYGSGGYPGELILQDMRTMHGSQMKDADCLVFSPPCQEFSYMAMPWTRAKQIAAALRDEVLFPDGYTGSRTVRELRELFDTCFRIQREASEAAGRYIPMVVENVKGAQPWVGKAKAHYGSFYLWGDVEMVGNRIVAGPLAFAGQTVSAGQATKNAGGSWFAITHNTESGVGQNPDGLKVPGIDLHDVGFNVAAAQRYREGVKDRDTDGNVRDHPSAFGWKSPRTSSRSNSRKAASAMIAKIPFALASVIAPADKP